jgi:NAD-dependent dihydropyrimidine dehydrogenase PreA subunit
MPRGLRSRYAEAVIHRLSRSYTCRFGAPVVDRVDTAIFVQRYFMNCMGCDYCHDSCCQYGADVDVENVARVEARAAEIEAFTGIPRSRWWTGVWNDDAEFPGGRQTRTAVEDGACVFRSRAGRGCMLHSFALEKGLDYHELKPLVSSLFPVTFDYGLLHPSNEIADRSLQCIGDGPTLYEGVRSEIERLCRGEVAESEATR